MQEKEAKFLQEKQCPNSNTRTAISQKQFEISDAREAMHQPKKQRNAREAASTLQEKQFNKGTQQCKSISAGMQEKQLQDKHARETMQDEQCSNVLQQKH